MPIYEYQCSACAHQFEMIQKFSDAPIKKCPECGKLKVQKLVSAPSFQLKGNGWYVTDFRDKDKNNKAKPCSDKPSTGSKDSKTSKDNDSKNSAASSNKQSQSSGEVVA